VLGNIVSNAVKFTQEGGVTVSYSWRAEGEVVAVTLEVTDTGIGIPADRLETIFDAYMQADRRIATRFGGTGLGLAIARKLVEMMGGTISVRSVVGVGTTFRIDLDLKKAPIWHPCRRLQHFQDLARAEYTPLVLLAEDNVVNVKVATKILERCGCAVEVAQDGLQAVSMATARRYDLILMDVHMPMCDGLEATRALRQAERREGDAPMRIFALTADALEEERNECLAAGMDGVLTKPITVATLQKALEEAMG
jgi:CheY-like chemotaxis protein